MAAAMELCNGLCHQHVQIASAAVPALPFLVEAFSAASDRLKVELLDIFLGLAIASRPERHEEYAAAAGERSPGIPEWIGVVRAALERLLPSIEPLRTHREPDLAELAKAVVEELASTNDAIQRHRDVGQVLRPNFHVASAEFRKFLYAQRYPPRLLWVKPEDMLLRRRKGSLRLFVRRGDPVDRECRARRDYQEAIAMNVGVAFEAHCKTDEWTVCRVFVPRDDDEAERLMIPSTVVKYSAAQDSLWAVVVAREWWWWILKRICSQSSHAFGWLP